MSECATWQPIETAPKDGRMILVCLPRQSNLVVRAWYRDYKGFWLTDQETDGGISRPAWFHEGDLWHPVPLLPDNTKGEPMSTNLHDKMLAAIDALFSASDAMEEEVAENLLLDVRDAINKHKLAAESLTEGLRLDDWPKIGCVNHDCDKCKAQQEPLIPFRHGCKWCGKTDGCEHQQPAREWVSLTMSEKHELNERLNLQGRFPVIAAIEEIIRRKNT